MRVIRSAKAMQRLSAGWRREGVRVALVPTMGFLHAGHLSLIDRAREAVGETGKVIVSIFVNGQQFGPGEDFKKYPRDEKADLKACRKEGVDVVFIPAEDEMYPRGNPKEGPFSTFVTEETLSRGMEGASRPVHFRGVATVVAKLFNITLPDASVFGGKDFQQAVVICRMVRDLNFPIKIIIQPTVREEDGVAMSSRNARLNKKQRQQAVALSEALKEARKFIRRDRAGMPAARLRGRLEKSIEKYSEAKLDYIEFFDPFTLEPVSRVRNGTRMALAVYFGDVRLIDNAGL